MEIRHGFTLIELIIVILVMGILASVAAPKLLNIGCSATDHGLMYTLDTVRDAIDHYRLDHSGQFPPCTGGGADFRTALQPYLRGTFPNCPVGPAQNNEVSSFVGSVTVGVAMPSKGWKFNTSTGQFICNYRKATNCFSGIMYDEL